MGHEDTRDNGLAGNHRMSDVKVSQGPEGRRLNVSPARQGWGSIAMIASAVGAALALLPQPYFAISVRGTSLSNKPESQIFR
jgi:hypothetical protein